MNDLFRRFETDDALLTSRYRQCATAWNSIAYRFRLCAEADIGFTKLHQTSDVNLNHEELVQRANYLFTFFVSGQATIESLAYSVFVMAAMLDASQFAVDSVKDQKKISLSYTTKLLKKHHSHAPITLLLAALTSDSEYVRWEGIRNIIAHRQHPSETTLVHLGGAPVPAKQFFEELATPDVAKHAVRQDDVNLDSSTTRSRREWLAGRLEPLITAAGEFAALYFGTFPAK